MIALLRRAAGRKSGLARAPHDGAKTRCCIMLITGVIDGEAMIFCVVDSALSALLKNRSGLWLLCESNAMFCTSSAFVFGGVHLFALDGVPLMTSFHR